MNGHASLATGIREAGINSSVSELQHDVDRLTEVLHELRERTSPVRVERPPVPNGAEEVGMVKDVDRCEIDYRIQSLRGNVRALINTAESTIAELRI